MIVAQYEKYSAVPEEVISAKEIQEPLLAYDEVLIKVLASPINPADLLMLKGQYGSLPPLPAIGGSEGVGKVIKQGQNIIHPAIGQTVLLPTGMGTWASHLVSKANVLIPLPNDADAKQLSMMKVNPPTALLLLEKFVDLKADDWVIQNAANSGVGSYLMQLAKIKGVRTINVVRRDSAVELVKSYGGNEVLVDGPDLSERVQKILGNQHLMLAIDAVGGSASNRLASSLSEGGTLVTYGSMSGEPAQIGADSLVFRNVTFKGFWLAKWFKESSQEEKTALFSKITQFIAKGAIFTEIEAEYPLEQIKLAIKAAESGKRNGKILIIPQHEIV
ncbi:MAG: trans-2-enoyl-CoA reductase [Paraglaciecola sp.]|jgi:trans-2-enoyl-CoA reductase